jgi:hypothetical protein
MADHQERSPWLADGLRNEQRHGEAPGALRAGDGNLDDLAGDGDEIGRRDLEGLRGRIGQILTINTLPEFGEQFRAAPSWPPMVTTEGTSGTQSPRSP